MQVRSTSIGPNRKRPSVSARAQIALSALMLGERADYIGEPVCQLTHALQCAALAEQAGDSNEAILAALFHDIGHLIAPETALNLDGLGIADHEQIGAAWLRELGFSTRVCELVSGHVAAKRYLAYKRTGYVAKLSAASLGTLALQGGPMTAAEALAFENDELFDAKLRLRGRDEAAKHPKRRVPAPTHYLDLICSHLTEQP